MREFIQMLVDILDLKLEGLTYKQIDATLSLPKRSYLIMNGKRARFIFDSGILER